MTADALSATVLQFIDTSIDSIPALEALLLLREHENISWNHEEVATRLYVEQSRARALLGSLHRQQLLVLEGSPPRYRFGPAAMDQREIVTQVASAYRLHLVAITQLIHSKGPPAVRQFARAFNIKKER